MKCEFCGHEYEEGEKFCQQCGAKLPEGKQEDVTSVSDVAKSVETMVKSLPKKTLAIIGGAIAAVVVVVIILAVALSGGGSNGSFTYADNGAVSLAYSSDDAEYYLIGKGLAESTGLENYYYSTASLDRSVIAVMGEENELFCYNGKEFESVASDVYSYALSADGSAIAYITDVSDDYQTAVLMLYTVSSGEEKEIYDEVYPETNLCISPDGKTVAFQGDYDSEDAETSLLVSVKGGEPENIDKSAYPAAIANGGKYFYYYKYDSSDYTNDLYVMKDLKDETKLTTLDYTVTLYLNEDMSEMVYVDEGRSYYSVKGSDKEKLENGSFYGVLMPSGAMATSGDGFVLYGIDSFAGKVVSVDNGLNYINKDFESERIDSEFNAAQLSKNGKSLLYTDYDGNLHYVKDLTKSLEDETILEDEEISSFVATDDLKKIYFVNYDDELQYAKNGGEAEKIADDVAYLTMGTDRETVYFLSDYRNGLGELATSKNGGEEKLVENGEDLTRVSSYFGKLLTCVGESNADTGYSMYEITGGKLELLVPGVNG